MVTPESFITNAIARAGIWILRIGNPLSALQIDIGFKIVLEYHEKMTISWFCLINTADMRSL